MTRYAIGLDYGTNSCRSLIVNLDNGAEVASHVYNYPSGLQGVIVDPRDPNVARQNPADYRDGLIAIVVEGLKKARVADPAFSPDAVVGIGVDTTGSTPMPVDRCGTPLALRPGFKDNPDAQAWLWKDHTSHAEAAEITALARVLRPAYLAKCGGTYSSEWFWAKILHLKRAAPRVFEAAFSFVELCDWIPALLTGVEDPLALKRGVCAAGHKAMYAETWGGLPDKAFLAALDPALADLRDRLYTTAHTADVKAGGLCAGWADTLGLPAGIAVAVGAFDAHMGAVGAGCAAGKLAKILGTSTCDLLVAPNDRPLQDIPGVCGIVDGSVMPGYIGIEAGQSAVGDIFLWFVNHLVPDTYGASQGEKFVALDQAAAGFKPGESGLLALDWNNGNRCVLTDVRLSGLLLGQTLHTTAAEIYRALVEATAFGARMIVDRVRAYGVPVEQVITCGGLAVKSPFLMQVYADVLNMPMAVAASDQTCALGAALFGAVAAGAFPDIETAQAKVCRVRERVYRPIAANAAVYAELFTLYRQLHDGFGTAAWSGGMATVMKELIALRERQR
ncbi:MAG: ribulokinase [Lentisphaerae bacterium]|jgi:L-ribulokinase|nr:ribulokinase [Kiritimatiellia bacterium]MDD4440558.1 ribulokinase [Kiritimatiellia bacterium]NLC79988.1 ribulokinase [Lentisphaerota bacterium]